MADDTKEIRLTAEDWSMLRIAMDNDVLDNRFAATLNDEYAQKQERRMALRDRLYTLGVFAQGPFAVVMRVEEGTEPTIRPEEENKELL